MPRLTPTEMFGISAKAAALAVYLPEGASISLTATTLEITVGEVTYSVAYTEKTLREVADSVSSLSGVVFSNPLNVSWPLVPGSLSYAGEVAADGAHLVRVDGHAVKVGSETRIRVLPPYSENRLLPWFPRISSGSVSINHNGSDYLFTVPEYADQEWSPRFGKPYVDQRGEKPTHVDMTTIRVSRTPIHWEKNNVGLVVDGVRVGHAIVKDVDVNNGFIRLTNRIDSRAQDVRVDYTYREESLVYKKVNLNPAPDQNPSIIDSAVAIYLRPSHWTGGMTNARTVYHSVASSVTGAISFIPQEDTPILLVGAFKVRSAGSKKDVSTVDTRTRGGGLADGSFDKALEMNREAFSVADYGRYEGVPFPASMSGVLTLPRSTLDRYSEDYIQSVIQRHIAVGGHILVDLREGE